MDYFEDILPNTALTTDGAIRPLLESLPPLVWITQLLFTGDLALYEVARSVGSESAAAFNRAFKQCVGTPPGSRARSHDRAPVVGDG